MSCEVSISNPLPVFEWRYQELLADCKFNCKPDESKWLALPAKGQVIYPASGQTRKSVVSIAKDRPSTFYLCKATNNLGNASHVVSFHRTGELHMYGKLHIASSSFPIFLLIDQFLY